MLKIDFLQNSYKYFIILYNYNENCKFNLMKASNNARIYYYKR